MLKTFIERPVLSTVISIFFVVLGIIGIYTLPVEEYPDIAPPTINVSTTYSGADANAVMNSVIIPLEEQINGVEDMTYMTSSASNGGSASINVFFKQGVDPDIATVNVQNRVSKANSLMPSEVTQNGITVQKQQSSIILMIQLTSTNSDYDKVFLQNYAQINLVPQIKRVSGVGNVQVFGGGDYAMRIWLKPDVMMSYGVTSAEVLAALQDQNIEAAPGELGERGDQTFQYTLKFTGRLKTVEEFENIIIRSQESSVLRLKDVAKIELAAQAYNVIAKGNGLPVATFAISQTAGSNAQDIITEVKALMEEAGKELPPGVTYNYMMDSSEFLNVAIGKLVSTLFEVFVLVFLIILVFLQNFRATLIPAVAVPVSVIGTFFFLSLFGFTINLLTLFALVLAIGMVVDDAIVVVEAVYAQIDAGEKDVKAATIKTLGEIAPAIISMTLVSVAVFLPVSFISGTSGEFYKQFGLTLAVSILISGVNALTLSPALSAMFLKAHEKPKAGDKNPIHIFYNNFNKFFDWATNGYRSILEFLSHKNRRWISLATVALFSFIMYFLITILPPGFVPQEDSGAALGMVSLSPGSSLERTDSTLAQVTKLANEIPGVKTVTTICGYSFASGRGSSYGSVIIKLLPWDERDLTTDQVVAIMQQKTAAIKNATFIFFGVPTLQGFGISTGVEMQLQDRTGGDIDMFYQVASEFLGKLQARPEVMVTLNKFDPRFPQKQVEANIPKIKDAGLTLSEVMTALQMNVGSLYASNFNTYGKQYRVIVQAAPEYRNKVDDLNNIYMETSSGEMSPITEFITLSDVTGPQSLARFNLYSSMELTIIPNFQAGYTSGDVFKAIDEIGLPLGYSYEYSGMTREEVGSSSNTSLIFILCVVFVYLLLAALYESYILPLAVIFSLPIGLAGVFLFIYISMITGSGIANNIYVQISMIMLIGLLAKTAILIVEYALQRRQQGMDIVEAAIGGAVARLRPVMMTALTCIIGLIPLAIATGAGAIGNRSIGISAVGGMMLGTFIGTLVVPVLFIIFQSLHERFSSKKIVSNDTEL
ncbi:transporter, hydrophobe/amphiphile efflux-1 (HAE1) family [Chloroherpeton thalassium ATCC 35110]|uniref:Transporter, hydrophobe/amphiphile efflux-1 (HAE1) family n=1 Tax=Chloroherpeton thalassium (strain ATCC 35110 / GB-78) TaxID=517418 RepID=B3QT38_CHLT3|nr:efflux RND transporter permease subunit [Chloroherpeton thalassium]ACF14137.1 transporter, hydrophobe/amphiphile efflux-1 (HAE1) family [Chloroherpeton thalassium ATCC 35110]